MLFRLKDFRQFKKLYQSEMSALLEVNQSSVSRMELKPSAELSYLQYQKLVDKFGENDVNEFIVTSEAPVITGNTNEGNGTQTNSVNVGNSSAMEVIREQSKALTEAVKKNSELNERLLSLLENIMNK